MGTAFFRTFFKAVFFLAAVFFFPAFFLPVAFLLNFIVMPAAVAAATKIWIERINADSKVAVDMAK